MNTPFSSGEAQIIYDTPDFTITEPGAYVLCAVTGEKIALSNLRYWSVKRQEAYKDAAAALTAYQADGNTI